MGFTLPTHRYTHALSKQQNPQLDLCASFCLSYRPLIPSFWTPISSRRGFMGGRTSSLQRNTISIWLSTALFQTRHPLNQGITVIQLSDHSISFYLPLSPSFRLKISKSDVINIDSAIVCRHFISMYIRLKCLTEKDLLYCMYLNRKSSFAARESRLVLGWRLGLGLV